MTAPGTSSEVKTQQETSPLVASAYAIRQVPFASYGRAGYAKPCFQILCRLAGNVQNLLNAGLQPPAVEWKSRCQLP